MSKKTCHDSILYCCSFTYFSNAGRKGEQWILIDYVNVVVHVMLTEPRKFYELEEMWSDGPAMEHNELKSITLKTYNSCNSGIVPKEILQEK